MDVRAETTTEPEKSATRVPVRTCVGCREQTEQAVLVRFVLGPDDQLVPDLAGGAFGRGAWVHARRECLEKAPRGMAKSFRAGVKTSGRELASLLSAAADRRIKALFGSAQRAKRLVLGTSAVDEALESGRVRLLIVACDARAAADGARVQSAVSRGLAVAWGTKAELGAIVGRSDTALVGVLDNGLARALREACELTALSAQSGIVAEAGASAEEG